MGRPPSAPPASGSGKQTMAPPRPPSTTAIDAPIITLFILSVALKLLLMPSYTSTDFEVHRNWLAITNSLPLSQWYYDKTSEWTLDYPPFFAFFEYFLSIFASKIDPQLVQLSSRPVISPQIVLFQRISVVLSDFVLFYAVYAYCASWPSGNASTTTYKRLVVMVITIFDAGLLFVDHIHFQYNGILLGILILSATKMRMGKDLQGAFLYTVLLMLKHIFLYAAPLYFVYLLRHYCYYSVENENGKKKKFSMGKFIQLGVLVVSIITLAFGSIIFAQEDKIAGLKQIFERLFPVQRGLCHAYWAPNVWALYAFMDKLLVASGLFSSSVGGGVGRMSGGLVQEASFAVLPSVSPLVCGLLTLLSMVPVLVTIWQKPHPSVFMSALVFCMHSAFMVGYHVHEKAILQVVLPLALLAADSVNDMRLYRFAAISSALSLFPLLFTPAEQLTKILIALTHGFLAYATLNPFLKETLPKNPSKKVKMHFGETLYLILLVCVAVGAMGFKYLPKIGVKYPFLPLMAISVAGAIANLYVWAFAMYQHFRKVDAVKSNSLQV